nr:MAG TPA: hypothetical protein [Caudoviricetes sp.]
MGFFCALTIDIGGCLSHYIFAQRAESVIVLANSGNGNRSFLENCLKC